MSAAPWCRTMDNLSLLVVAWSNRCAEEWKCIQAGSADCASHLRVCKFYRSACDVRCLALALCSGLEMICGRSIPHAACSPAARLR